MTARRMKKWDRPLPKFQGGMTNTFRYKGIQLSVNAYFLWQ
jgi:hypothetical protein